MRGRGGERRNTEPVEKPSEGLFWRLHRFLLRNEIDPRVFGVKQRGELKRISHQPYFFRHMGSVLVVPLFADEELVRVYDLVPYRKGDRIPRRLAMPNHQRLVARVRVHVQLSRQRGSRFGALLEAPLCVARDGAVFVLDGDLWQKQDFAGAALDRVLAFLLNLWLLVALSLPLGGRSGEGCVPGCVSLGRHGALAGAGGAAAGRGSGE